MHHVAEFILFFLLVIGTYLGLNYYLASWTVRHLPPLLAHARMVKLLFLLMGLLFPLAMMAVRKYSGPLPAYFYVLSLTWVGISLIWFDYALISDIIEFFILKIRPATKTAAIAAPLVMILTLTTSAAALWHAVIKLPNIKTVEIPVRNLPASLDGFRIVQLSDVHLSFMVSHRQLERLAAQIKELKPDLILLTGDLYDRGFKGLHLLPDLGKELSAPYGKYGVLGNHEFYGGLSNSEAVYAMLGFKLLRQQLTVLPNGLQLAGVDDRKTAGITDAEVRKLLSGLKKDSPSIFLSHEPVGLEIAAENNVTLMLSGHTHNGQIFPFNLLTRMRYKRNYGLYRINDSFLYVTSGTFYWGPPMRFFSDCEIPLILLRKKELREVQ